MARLRVAGIAAVALVACGPTVGRRRQSFPRSAKTAVFSFGVIDGLGHGNLHGGKVKSFRNLQTGRDLAARFHLNRFLEEEARKVPFGHYDLVFAQPGFPDLERPVDVSHSEVNFEVCVTTATVHLVPLYGIAKYAPGFEAHVVSFKNDEYGLDLASSFKANTAMKVPYGSYDLSVQNQGFDSISEQVDIFQPEAWILINPVVGSAESAFPAPQVTLSGIVRNVEAAEQPIYVRLVHTFPGTVGFSADADSKLIISGRGGTFTLMGTLPYGEYALITIGRSGVLDFREVQVSSDLKQPIVIDLSSKAKSASTKEGSN